MAYSNTQKIVLFAGSSIAIFAASLAVGPLIRRFHLGGDAAGDGMLSGMVGLAMWAAALGLSIAALVMTARNWRHLKPLARLFGILPVMGYLVAIIVISV